MAYEIERKFLLKSDAWRADIYHTRDIKQAYFCNTEKASMRVRISDKAAYLSAKTMTIDIRRHEFEYQIPLHDGEFMIEYMCSGSAIIKQRHLVKVDQHTWEIDEFEGDNKGLIVAEVELKHESELFMKPAWLGQEVSRDLRFMNMSLVTNPYKGWP